MSGIKNAHIDETTLAEGGGRISPRNWAKNVWTIFGGKCGVMRLYIDAPSSGSKTLTRRPSAIAMQHIGCHDGP